MLYACIKRYFLCAIFVFQYYCIYFLKDTSKKKENAKCEETSPTGVSTGTAKSDDQKSNSSSSSAGSESRLLINKWQNNINNIHRSQRGKLLPISIEDNRFQHSRIPSKGCQLCCSNFCNQDPAMNWKWNLQIEKSTCELYHWDLSNVVLTYLRILSIVDVYIFTLF